MNFDYDVIVVGAGVGGLGCAALLSHSGLRTLVLEKNNYIGGRCVSYKKNNCVIDAFIHMFTSCENGPHGQILKQTEMEDAIKFWHVDPANKPALILHGKSHVYPDLSYASDEDMRDTFKGLLMPDKDYEAALKLNTDIYGMPEEKTHEIDNLTFLEWLQKYSSHEALLALHAHRCMLMGVVGLHEASAGEAIRMTQRWQQKGNLGYPIGGCQAIPDGFAKIIRHYGGEIRTKARVSKILIDKGASAGVILDSGEEISARAVVSNSGLKETVINMISEDALPQEYLDYVRGLTCGMFGSDDFMNMFLNIKVLLDEPIIEPPVIFAVGLAPVGISGEQNSLKPFTESNSQYIHQYNTFMPIPSNMDPSLVPSGQQILNFPGMLFPGTSDLKQAIDDQINFLEILYPGLKQHILWTDVIKGSAVKQYSGRQQSDIIGLAQIVGQVGKDRPSPVSPLPGLFFTGADVGQDNIGTELAAESALRVAPIIQDFLGS